jgi:hypothetical protein
MPVLVLVCLTCRGVVVFGSAGWMHRDPAAACPDLVVAWPPPDDHDDD